MTTEKNIVKMVNKNKSKDNEPAILKVLVQEHARIYERDVWLNEQLDRVVGQVNEYGKLITENEQDLRAVMKVIVLAKNEFLKKE